MRLFTYFLCSLGFLIATPLSAVTMVNEPTVSASQAESAESVVRTKLVIRHTDGKIETKNGTYNVRSAEVTDNRKIDSWYQPDTDANVSLYFREDRLVKVIISK